MHLQNGIIKVKLQSESPVYITYKGNESILTIKAKLKQQTDVPIEKQILSYSSGCLVQDSDSIGVIAEYCGRLINMNLDIGILGGASNITPFNAPDMTCRECFEERSFGAPGTAPSFRRLGKGINFEAYCRNMNCIALNNSVIIPLGMCASESGICNYAEVVYELPCPACKALVRPEEINDVNFYDCTVTIKCRVTNAACTYQYDILAPSDKYLALKEPEKLLSYRFIKFTVK